MDRAIAKTLNHHGYGFQARVLQEALITDSSAPSEWKLSDWELPVERHGRDTRIDFVLRQWDNRYLVAECKREDPAYHWVFFKSSPRQRGYRDRLVGFDGLGMRSGAKQFHVKTCLIDTHVPGPASEGIAVTSGEKGDSTGNRDSIEKACSQVMRGTAGFLHHLRAVQLFESPLGGQTRWVYPVIFTTAKLFYAAGDVSTADLETGHLTAEQVGAEEVPWLWYRSNRSRGLTPVRPESLNREAAQENRAVELWFARGIAIVSVSGVRDFMDSGLGTLNDDQITTLSGHEL
jgi:hypothetical protein